MGTRIVFHHGDRLTSTTLVTNGGGELLERVL
jgi:hypothetical protein